VKIADEPRDVLLLRSDMEMVMSRASHTPVDEETATKEDEAYDRAEAEAAQAQVAAETQEAEAEAETEANADASASETASSEPSPRTGGMAYGKKKKNVSNPFG